MGHTLTSHVGRKVLCVFGQYNYGNAERGEGYEYSNFLPAFRDLGCVVEFFDSFSKALYKDFEDLNRRLLDAVECFRPEIVFVVPMNCEIWLETLALIRKAGPKVVFWGADDSWRYEQLTRFFVPEIDIWITTSNEALKKGQEEGVRNMMLSQWAARGAQLQMPLPAKDCRYQVSFIGSNYGNRSQWIGKLREAGIAVDCFGFGWPNGPVTTDEISRIIRESILSLNFGDSGVQLRGTSLYRSRQIKARVFEVTGAGGCLLTEQVDELDAYLTPGCEIEVFCGIEDLVNKVRYLLSHPECRDAIAFAGFKKTRDVHTYENRFIEVLSKVAPSDCGKVEAQVFNAVAQGHSLGMFLRAFRMIFVFPFQLILGGERGIRVARRILYELSWRVFGRKTYMASGWVGRLFYKDC